MTELRVFEIANQFGVDVRAVQDVLHRLGEGARAPETKLNAPITRKVQDALASGGEHPPLPSEAASAKRRVKPAPPLREASVRRPRTPKVIRTDPKRPMTPFARSMRAQHSESIRAAIPALAANLQRSYAHGLDGEAIVAFHDIHATEHYGFCTLGGDPLAPADFVGTDIRALLAPIRAIDRGYRERGWTPPNGFVGFELGKGHVWFAQSIKSLRLKSERLDAQTLQPLTLLHSAGEPPRLNPRAQLFTPGMVPPVATEIGVGDDRPEESFLLHEEFLHLAVDSLAGAEVLEPLPVHLNALWVFARPIVMQRVGDSDRHVRAIWFRQGEVAWRIRTYVAGVGGDGAANVKQVGPQLGGRLPFVPVWDDTRPEQKLIAAVWALMAQGGVTESARTGELPGPGADLQHPHDLTIVRVKAGTSHAAVYRDGGGGEPADRHAWSVRGHWRQQPYPSLGHDDDGRFLTKPIWIASYTKGTSGAPAERKVITVRP